MNLFDEPDWTIPKNLRPKCGAKKAQPKEVQTRAPDELSSTNLKCLECNFTWFTG